MSIRPLDLQTLFIKMANVGKEQAQIQKSVENQQAREAGHIIKEEKERDSAVNKVEEDKPADSVKDKNRDETNQHETGHREKEDKEGGDKPKYFTDPKLGHNLDISG